MPDLELTVELDGVARRLGAERGFTVHSGINATDDVFYAETPEWIAELTRLGAHQCRDGERGAVRRRPPAWLARRDDLRLLEQPGAGASLYDQGPERLHEGWRQSIEVALETAVNLDL